MSAPPRPAQVGRTGLSGLLVGLLAGALACAPPSATPRPAGGAQPVGGLDAAGTPLPTVAAGGVPGRIVAVRGAALVAIEGGRAKTIVPAPGGGAVRAPAWSPDGRSVAYVVAPPAPPPRGGRPSPADLPTSDIALAAADGSDQRVLVAHDQPGAQLDRPAWLPDGRSLLYGYYRPVYDADQFVRDEVEVRQVDLGSGRTTTVARGAGNPAVSADGRLLAYVTEDAIAGPSLRVAALAGGGERVLIASGQFPQLQAPAFSPDGQTIALSAVSLPAAAGAPGASDHPIVDLARRLLAPARAEAHGRPWEIWRVPVGGGAAVQVTRIGEDEPVARWSADGARLLILGGGGLYLHDLRSGQSAFASADGGNLGMDWRG